jgi:hypothetical protein
LQKAGYDGGVGGDRRLGEASMSITNVPDVGGERKGSHAVPAAKAPARRASRRREKHVGGRRFVGNREIVPDLIELSVWLLLPVCLGAVFYKPIPDRYRDWTTAAFFVLLSAALVREFLWQQKAWVGRRDIELRSRFRRVVIPFDQILAVLVRSGREGPRLIVHAAGSIGTYSVATHAKQSQLVLRLLRRYCPRGVVIGDERCVSVDSLDVAEARMAARSLILWEVRRAKTEAIAHLVEGLLCLALGSFFVYLEESGEQQNAGLLIPVLLIALGIASVWKGVWSARSRRKLMYLERAR